LLLAVFASMIGGARVALPQTAPATAPGPSQLIQFLNQTIAWYRQSALERAIATESDDQTIVYENGQIADQLVRLAFDFARAQAEALTKQGQAAPGQTSGAGAPSEGYQGLRRMEEKIDKQYQDAQAELESDTKRLAAATGRTRHELESQILELQSELKLAAVRRDAVRGMMEFVTGTSANGVGASGLRGQVEELASSVPAATLNSANATQGGGVSASPRPSAAPPATSGTDVSGIWGLTADLVTLSGRIRTIDSIIDQTKALAKTSRDIRAPFITELRGLSRQGDQLATEADTADAALLAKEKQQLDGLAAQYKQTSSAIVPLSRQSVLLNLHQRNLKTWRDALEIRYQTGLKRLGFRVGFLCVIVLAVIFAAGLWRRGVYRYVHEPRRRYQFLLLRKIVLGIAIALIIAFTLAGRLGSIVTFAGLLTAGVAVALQNVILSVVGYFFLIGKFGIRVGDRVQIDGVAGEVIEIGLVRMHLMELGRGGFDAPTGRVVAFSNSIVFQPGAGLFKQIPGTSFVWHEIALSLPRGVDYGLIKETLLAAVTGVLSDYRAELDRQYREMERTVLSVPSDALQPRIRLRATSSAVEVVIRFPVDAHHGAEIDERVSHALVKALEGESRLKAGGSDTPEIHLRTDLSAPGTTT